MIFFKLDDSFRNMLYVDVCFFLTHNFFLTFQLILGTKNGKVITFEFYIDSFSCKVKNFFALKFSGLMQFFFCMLPSLSLFEIMNIINGFSTTYFVKHPYSINVFRENF